VAAGFGKDKPAFAGMPPVREAKQVRGVGEGSPHHHLSLSGLNMKKNDPATRTNPPPPVEKKTQSVPHRESSGRGHYRKLSDRKALCRIEAGYRYLSLLDCAKPS